MPFVITWAVIAHTWKSTVFAQLFELQTLHYMTLFRDKNTRYQTLLIYSTSFIPLSAVSSVYQTTAQYITLYTSIYSLDYNIYAATYTQL